MSPTARHYSPLLRILEATVFVLFCSLALVWQTARAGSVAVTLRAGSFEIGQDDQGYGEIRMAGFNPSCDPGNPRLPSRIFNILLPPRADLTTLSLSLRDVEPLDVSGYFNVGPAPPAVTWSNGEQVTEWGEGKQIVDGRNMEVFGVDAGYPGAHADLLTYSQMRKYKFARIEFWPFRYNPVRGTLTRVESVTVEIDFDELGVIDRDLLDDGAMDWVAPSLFANSHDCRDYYGPAEEAYRPAEYVIITTNAIVEGSLMLDQFVAQKRFGGRTVMVVTEDDFGALDGQAPNNRAEKIRQWLIENYAHLKTLYVLLIGDPHPYEYGEGDIPMKMCWPRGVYQNDTHESPTDYFYADLTGNWDLDGDLNYGEYYDDFGPGGLDLAPEVFVGRIPVYDDDYATLDAILGKIIRYEVEEGPPIWRKRILLPMSFYYPPYDNAELAEQLKDDYLDSLGWFSWRMYQEGGGACGITSAYTGEEELRGGNVVRDRWADGEFGVVLWAGHGCALYTLVGYETGDCWDGYLLSCYQCGALDDTHPSFTFQSSCSNSLPQVPNNLSFSLLAHGAISTVSATAAAWILWGGYGHFDGNPGGSGIGYDYVSKLVQMMDAGHALCLTKANATATGSMSLMNYLTHNLYGDPSISLASKGRCPWVDATSGPLGDTGKGRGVAWGDYDLDGDQDLYITNYGSANKLLRNDGTGFANATAGPLGNCGLAGGAAWGDFDNDGDLDLYLANEGTNNLLRNDGAGVFVNVTTSPLDDGGQGRTVSWVDYDNDGDLDIYLLNHSAANKLFRNDGGGVFADATSGPLADESRGSGMAWGDYDNDGDRDVYIGIWGNNKLLRNDGAGLFTNVTSGPLGDRRYCSGAAWGDYDNDCDLDLYVVNSGGNKLLRNDGGGAFSDVTGGPLGDTGNGMGVAWGDFNNDGRLDLYLTNLGSPNRLLMNVGNGEFIDATCGCVAGPDSGRGVACSDYDGDGDVDLYITSDRDNKLFRSILWCGHWLHVRLVGVLSNSWGIGARIRVVSGGLCQIREITGGSGYMSQNSLIAEFGIGEEVVIDTVEVRWPSGVLQTLTGVSGDQLVTITEAAGIPVPAGVTGVVRESSLHPNRPNPFKSFTAIDYYLCEETVVGLSVYDTMGRKVRHIIGPCTQPPGDYCLMWDGCDEEGCEVAPGIYVIRLETASDQLIGKVVLIR
jgi:hypothetical protein